MSASIEAGFLPGSKKEALIAPDRTWPGRTISDRDNDLATSRTNGNEAAGGRHRDVLARAVPGSRLPDAKHAVSGRVRAHRDRPARAAVPRGGLRAGVPDGVPTNGASGARSPSTSSRRPARPRRPAPQARTLRIGARAPRVIRAPPALVARPQHGALRRAHHPAMPLGPARELPVPSRDAPGTVLAPVPTIARCPLAPPRHRPAASRDAHATFRAAPR